MTFFFLFRLTTNHIIKLIRSPNKIIITIFLNFIILYNLLLFTTIDSVWNISSLCYINYKLIYYFNIIIPIDSQYILSKKIISFWDMNCTKSTIGNVYVLTLAYRIKDYLSQLSQCTSFNDVSKPFTTWSYIFVIRIPHMDSFTSVRSTISRWSSQECK